MRMSRRMGLLGGKKLVLPTLAELFADMTVIDNFGINNSSSSIVSLHGLDFDANPSIYIFAFNKDSFAIHRLQNRYNKTTLYRATDDSNATDIYIEYNSTTKKYYYYLSKSGTGSSSVFGGTIIAATFPSYTDDQISTVFSNISVKNSAGMNHSSKSTVYLSNIDITGEIILTAYFGAMCAAFATSQTEYICTLDYEYSIIATYKARNYVTSSKTYLSTNGTSSASVYGGTILTI